MTQDPRSEGLGIIAELTTLPDASPRDLTNEQLGRLRTVFCDRQIGLFLFAKIIFLSRYSD